MRVRAEDTLRLGIASVTLSLLLALAVVTAHAGGDDSEIRPQSETRKCIDKTTKLLCRCRPPGCLSDACEKNCTRDCTCPIQGMSPGDFPDCNSNCGTVVGVPPD